MPATATARRPRKTSPARSVSDTRALEIACKVEERQNGHETLCEERFRNLTTNVDGVKADVRRLRDDVEKGMKTLNDDAKNAIDALGVRQDGYHKSNSDTLRDLSTGLSQLTLQVASGKGSLDGATGAVGFILKILPIGLSIATLIILTLRH